jgi:hypothetical protein
MTQDWEELDIILHREVIERDGGYEEDIQLLQAELEELKGVMPE